MRPQKFGSDAVLVGFSTHSGTVTAASIWDALPERKRVRESPPGSYERLFHEVGIERFFLRLRNSGRLADELREPRLERAIGVVYRPETERASHYFQADLRGRLMSLADDAPPPKREDVLELSVDSDRA